MIFLGTTEKASGLWLAKQGVLIVTPSLTDCKEMEVQCSVNGTSVCVPPGKVCDGVADCGNGKDERLCYRLAASQEEQPVGGGCM